MFSRIRRNDKDEHGALLGMVVIVAAALAILMVALISQAKSAVRRGNSLLSREELRRMAEEKFTRDRLALLRDRDVVNFSTAPLAFAGGEAQSHCQPVPSGLYLVIVATLSATNATAPHHIRLETILDWEPVKPAAPPNVPASGGRQKTVSQTIEDQLRAASIPEDQIQEAKEELLTQLKEILGADADSMVAMIETNEYRNDSEPSPEPAPSDDAFYLKPVSISAPAVGPTVRVWKETYN